VKRPRILLVAPFTELEWTIKPQLEEWADVASFDPPRLGVESSRQLRPITDRGLEELDRRGWDEFFLAVDGFGTEAAIAIALERRDAVLGLALGHATLSQRRTGERPPVNPDVWAALTQLLRQDRAEFGRHALVQVTGGSIDEELAQAMIERLPTDLDEAWEKLTAEVEFGGRLRELARPLLLAKHEGCLLHTSEGYEDAVAAFPDAMTASVPERCCGSPAFGDALQRFCESVIGTGER